MSELRKLMTAKTITPRQRVRRTKLTNAATYGDTKSKAGRLAAAQHLKTLRRKVWGSTWAKMKGN